jgi:hypothetical protein
MSTAELMGGYTAYTTPNTVLQELAAVRLHYQESVSVSVDPSISYSSSWVPISISLVAPPAC